MLKNSYRSQLLSQLNNEEYCLDERLQMAYGALISQDFPLLSKEQIIIDWFAVCIERNLQHAKNIFKMLNKCLKSDWLLTSCEKIDASKLIEVFVALEKGLKKKYNKSLLSCALLLLKNAGFHSYCRFDIQPVCQLTLLTCELTSFKGGLDDSTTKFGVPQSIDSGLDDLYDCLLIIHKITQQRNEFKLQFVEYVLPAILKLKYNFHQSAKFQSLLDELVVGEETEILCEAFKSSTSKQIPDHLKALVILMTKNEPQCDIVTLHSLVFSACVTACTKKSGTGPHYLSLFYILCTVAGFRLKLPYDTVSDVYKDCSFCLVILKELVDILQSNNIAASSESEEGVLSNFLINIQTQLTSKDYSISPELLRAIQSICIVYPESLRHVFSGFVLNIVFVQKLDTKVLKSYNSLLVDVIKMFADLNQLDKFFSLFFHGAIALSKEQTFTNLPCEMVLSNDFYLILSEKLKSLTGNQLKVILGRLIKVFSKDLLPRLEEENASDGNFHLLLELMVQVLCCILENAVVITPARWNILNEDLKRMISVAQRLGVVVMKSHETGFLIEFLNLVRVMADLELVMNQYVISLSSEKILPTVKSKDKTNKVCNLSKSHGFLSSSEWKRISELVIESYDKKLNHCWYDLLVQKYIRLGDPEVMTYLTLNADNEWLWLTLGQVSNSVPLKHMDFYTAQLLGDNTIITDNITKKLSALSNINVLTNRTFRAAMNLQVVKLMSKILPDETAISKMLVKIIDIHSVIKHTSDISLNLFGEKPQELNFIADALAQIINKYTWEQSPQSLSGEEKENFTSLTNMLTPLSPHSLNIETKRIFCLVLIGIACELRTEENLLSSILEHILGCMDDSSSIIPDSLEKRVLMYWVVTVVPTSFTLRQELIKVVVSKMVLNLDKCVEGMSQVLQSEEDLLSAILESLVLVHGNKSFKSKEDYNKLIKQLVYLASSVVQKKPKAKFLRLYTAALKAEFVVFKGRSPSLLPNLMDYLELLFRRFAENTVVEPGATELVDLTLIHKTEIKADVTDKVYKNIITELCNTDICPLLCYPTTVKSFFESIPLQHFENVLNEIYECQVESLQSEKELYALSNICELWHVIVSAHVDKDKAKIRLKMLTKILSDCLPLLERDGSRCHPLMLQLLHSISVSKSMALTWKLLDLILLILWDVPTDSESHLLPECLSVLSSLISARAELIYDRIPAFLQRLRKFVKSLVLLSSVAVNNNLHYNSTSTSSVNQVTRIIKTMTDQHAKHFVRIAPYLVADILHMLVTYTVETSVKDELQTCICYLLNVCDQHSTQVLQNLLPLPSTELFKTLSSTYRKNYKYTGKV